MRKIIVFFLMVVSVSTVFAQRAMLEGIVLDKKTGEKLIGVNVYLDKTSFGSFTDENGEFHLAKIPKGKYLLKVSYVGYEEYSRYISVKGKDVKKMKIELNASAESLNEVVVTAKSEARKIRENAMPISVISMNELKGTVSNVADILSKTTGVKLRNTGGVGSSSRISLRGLEGKRIGYFVDETPMSENADFMDFNDIPVDMIERIEVYKGIVPAKLGGSAIGGAVNIVLKEYPPKYMDLSYTLASFNTHKVSTVFKRNKNDYEFGIGGFYTYSDNNYKMKLNQRKGMVVKRDHDRFKKYTIGGAVSAKNNKLWFDKVKVEYAYTKTAKQIQGIEYNIQEAESFADALLIAPSFEKEDFFVEGLDFDLDMTFAHTIFKFQDKAMQSYRWDGSPSKPRTANGGEISTPSDATNKKNVFITKLNLNYLLNDWSSVNLNTTFNYSKGKPSDPLKDKTLGHKTNFDSDMYSWVTGLNHEMHFIDNKLTNSFTVKYYQYSMKTQLRPPLEVGSTIETKDVDNFKTNWGISEAIRYRFTPEFLLKASASYDVRLPSDKELLGDGFLIRASGDLIPERNTSCNVGLMYSKNTPNGLFSLEVNGFYMYLENMIKFNGGPLQSYYANFGEMRTIGGEIEIKWDATSFLYLYSNATYQNLRDVREFEEGSTVPNPTKGDRMPNIPYLFANAGLELHKENLFGGFGQNSRLFADLSFVEKYFYHFDKSTAPQKHIPRATTIDVGIEHSFENQRYIIGLQANNIADATVISEFNRPLPGRNFAVKLRYIFK